MTGREDFSGGVDVALQAQVPLPFVPGFLSLGERFFPTLLPHNFVAAYALDVFGSGSRRDLVLLASLQADPVGSPARELRQALGSQELGGRRGREPGSARKGATT